MIEFRQKEYSISEGHYTGPKDKDKVPGALEIIGKSALGGALVGSAVGAILKDSDTFEGALEGGKYGTIAGVLLKVFLNYLHKPMKRVTFQEVDKNIRREFGIYRLSGITVGDSINKRASVDEKFSFNDRNVCDYKLNFSVQNNQITMYTFGVSDAELDKIDHILDYYCKKYAGMKYSSSLINQNVNAYSVTITFTNYQVISNYIMELSNTLETKINLLDNKALVDGRLGDEEGEKTFSVSDIGKYDVMKILGISGVHFIKGLKTGWGKSMSNAIMTLLNETAKTLQAGELSKMDIPMPRGDFGNKYLEEVLKKLRYIEGFNYTVGDQSASNCMSLTQGLFIVTAVKDSGDAEDIDKIYWKPMKTKISRNDTGKVIVYTYSIQSKQEFEFIVKKLMSTKITFNIFEG